MDVNLLCSQEICNNLPGIINIIVNVLQFFLQFIVHVIAEQSKISQYFINLKMQSESYAKSTYNRLIAVAGLAYGLFTLHGYGTKTCTANRTGRIGNNGSWSLSLSLTSVNIFAWCCTFHLVPVPVTVLFSCSVNYTYLFSGVGYQP